jgi:hypothetical protein
MSGYPPILLTRVVPKRANKAQLVGLRNNALTEPYPQFRKIGCWKLPETSHSNLNCKTNSFAFLLEQQCETLRHMSEAKACDAARYFSEYPGHRFCPKR